MIDIPYKTNKVAERILCRSDPEVVASEYNDVNIDGVTYRVWSAYEDKIDIEQALGELMLRKLETDTNDETEGIALG